MNVVRHKHYARRWLGQVKAVCVPEGRCSEHNKSVGRYMHSRDVDTVLFENVGYRPEANAIDLGAGSGFMAFIERNEGGRESERTQLVQCFQ